VRELENVIERELILSRGTVLEFQELGGSGSEPAPLADHRPKEGPLQLDEVVSSHIRRVLQVANGKVHGKGGAAELLGVNPSTLRNRMNQLGIPYGRKSKR
jgi:DNA-binding NtrC family response regulator